MTMGITIWLQCGKDAALWACINFETVLVNNHFQRKETLSDYAKD